jgi:hypothetical protein
VLLPAIHLGATDSEALQRGGLSSSGDKSATGDKLGGREPDSTVVVRWRITALASVSRTAAADLAVAVGQLGQHRVVGHQIGVFVEIGGTI